MSIHVLIAFTGLCALLALTPGPDSFLVLRYSSGGVRSGVATAAGSAAGSLVWAAAVAGGLAAVLQESAMAYRIVKIAGGLYLLYLGVSGLLRSRREEPTAVTQEATSVRASAGAWAGLISCVLNPKVGLFFLAVVPQFLPARGAGAAQVMVLGAIDTAVAFGYLTVLALGAARAVRWLRRPKVSRALGRTTSAVLMAFGLGTLADTR